uniref:Cx9C motif-containing protein 4, mitochondrial n=1 Tax=Biomphalaria glabrata TaxID=6526 RepID=A0A2C9M6M1_BIOGL
MPLQDPCQKFACDLQSCLRVNDYQEWKCQHVIQALYNCCSNCGKGNSVVCSGINSNSNPIAQNTSLRYSEGKILPDEPTFLTNTPTILSLESMKPENINPESVDEFVDNMPTVLQPSIQAIEISKIDTDKKPKKSNKLNVKKY